MTVWPPLLFFLAGALLPLLGSDRARHVVSLLVPLASLYWLATVPAGEYWQVGLLEYELVLYRVDELSRIFGYAFHIVALIGIVFAMHVRDRVQQVSALFYAGSGLGAVFAGDLLSLVLFWELVAVSSVFLIWASRTARAYIAGMRYLVVQVLSGIVLLIGVLFHIHDGGSIAFGEIGLSGVAGWLIFIAFGIKCAFPLLHNWVTDAYPEGTPTGTVFLSAFTTKVAVYALARGYPGTELLIYIGAVMTCFPIFYAVIENDLRRVLAYSLINQVGFMVVGIGIGTALSMNGAVAHAFNDMVFKGLLFMTMGSVLHMTGRINASDLGGLYRTMPKTAVLCLIGAASISAFPLFSGFVSKSMVMSAALLEGYDIIWLMLLFASAGVFHHAGIKIPYFAFFGHDSGLRAKDPPVNMLIAMAIAAALCIGIGIYPSLLYQHLPFPVDYPAYDATHVLAQVQLLFFSAMAFVILKLTGVYPPELHSVNLDAEVVYRKWLPQTLRRISRFLGRAGSRIDQVAQGLLERRIVSYALGYWVDALIARTLQIRLLGLWIIVLLATYLGLSFI